MIDELFLLKGYDFKINDYIKVKHPTLDEIREYGEENYFRAINLFCLKPYDLMVQLTDAGIEYDTLDNYELFLLLYKSDIYKQDIKWFIGDYDFDIYINKQNNENVLYDKEKKVVIDRLGYSLISEFLKRINYIPDKNEFNPANKMAKKMILEEKRREMQRLKNNKKSFESFFGNLISALVWNEHSKETIDTIWNLHIYVFYNGFRRICKQNEYKNIMRGIYAGTLDSTKLNLEDINWASKIL